MAPQRQTCCSSQAGSDGGAEKTKVPGDATLAQQVIDHPLAAKSSSCSSGQRCDTPQPAADLSCSSASRCYAKDKSAVEPLAQAVEQVTTEPCKKTCGPSERAIEPAVSAGCDRQLVELDPDANEVGLDDACSCCVKGLLKLATTDPGQLTKLLQPLLLLQSNAATELRECCQRFASVLGCARLACCFPVARSGERDTKQVAEMAPRVAVPHLAVAVKPSERFVRQAFNINGMDCGDCGPIVAQAARKLTGVTDVVADYVRGVLTLSYDSERMQREAVASFVARATGFDVQVVEGAVHGDSKSTPNLPLAFVTWPPDALLARFGDVVPASASASSTSAHLRLNTEYASQPRTVLDELEPFGPSLRPPEQASARARATRDLVAVGTRTVILGALAVPVLVLAWADFPESGKTARGAAAVALSACIWSGAWPIYNSALRELIYLHQLGFNLLVSISVTVAFAFSALAYGFEVAGKAFADEPFFETIALLIALIYLGRTIQAATRRASGSALHEVESMQPRSALLLAPEGSGTTGIDVRLLHLGDLVRILPQSLVPSDGVVVKGRSEVDEAAMTGESVPSHKRPGSAVMAGTRNLGGTLDVAIGALAHVNSLARMATLVETAQASRPPMQDWVDTLSAFILPVAVACSGLALLVWSLVGVYVRRSGGGEAVVNAITYAIAILIVSCPCALGLAMPLVSSVGFRIGLREGVLFRSAASLQLAASVDVVAFDKTRTLTTGVLSVVQAHYLFDGAECVVPALVKASGHPVAQAVSRHFSGATSEPALHLGDIDEVAGRGLVASLGGLRLRGGSPAYTESTNEMFVQSVKDAQLTLFTVSIANQLIAVFGLADAPRPDAAALIRELHGLGKAVRIFSGDTPNTVHQLASELGIPLEHAHADCLPSTKEKLIVECQAQGKRVMYVGDGTNDAPALARADVAVAVAAGTDIAQSAASVLLLGSPETASLRRGVMSTLGVARTMRWTAFLCLGWAVAYNILAVLLASGVMVRVRIEPRWAGLGELASVVPVLVGAFSAFAVRKWQRSVKDL